MNVTLRIVLDEKKKSEHAFEQKEFRAIRADPFSTLREDKVREDLNNV